VIKDPRLPPVFGAHAADKEVINAPEVPVKGITGEACREIAVQGNGINKILEMITVIIHGCPEQIFPVIVKPVSEMVGFVVHDIVSAMGAENHVDKPLHNALKGLEGQPRRGTAIQRNSVKDPRKPLGVNPGNRKMKLKLVEAVRIPKAAETQTVPVKRGI